MSRAVRLGWPLAGGTMGQPFVDGPPVNTSIPVVSGLLDTVNSTYSIGSDNGNWSNFPSSFVNTVQKFAGVPGVWTDIASSTANPYTPATADGLLLRRKVVATNALGSTTAYSQPVQYLGQVSNSSYFPTTQHTDASFKTAMTVLNPIAYDDINSIRLAFSGRQGTSNGSQPSPGVGEVAAAGDVTITASIAYPIGATPVQVKFGGASSGTVLAGQAIYISDDTAFGVTVPRGAKYELKIFETSAAVLNCTASERLFGSDQLDFTATGAQYFAGAAITDQTAVAGPIAGGAGLAATGFVRWPAAIIGLTRRPSMCLYGDSIAYGAFYGAVPANGHHGIIAPSIGTAMAYINQGNPGDRLTWSNVANGNAGRAAAAKFCSHGWMQMMRNDKTVLTSNTTIRTAFNGCANTVFTSQGRPYVSNTCTAKASSSNGFIDYAGQLPLLNEAPSWATWNDDQRNKVSTAIQKTYDFATLLNDPAHQFEDSWRSPAYTGDGTHPTRAGYDLIKTSGLIDPVVDFGAVLLPTTPVVTYRRLLDDGTSFRLIDDGVSKRITE